MDPVITGGLISAGASLLGGMFGSRSSSDTARLNRKMQKEFAQHGIRWRVEDAKAAGLHPLYALGAQTPSFSPVYQEEPMAAALAEAGQSVGRAVAATSTQQERVMNALAAREALSRIEENDARADLLRAEAAGLRGAGMGPPMPSMVMDPSDVSSHPDANKVSLTPTELPTTRSGDVSVGAGSPPLWREFMLAPGFPIMLPGGMKGDASEALESLSESPTMMWAVYQENKRRYGERWGDEFVSRFILGESDPKNPGVLSRIFTGLKKEPRGVARGYIRR